MRPTAAADPRSRLLLRRVRPQTHACPHSDGSGPYGGLGRQCSHAHVVSLTVRDSAAMLDATHGAEAGQPLRRAVAQRPFLEEVARDPGRLRIAFTDRLSRGVGDSTQKSPPAVRRDRGAAGKSRAPGRRGRAAGRHRRRRPAAANGIASQRAMLRQRAAELGRAIGLEDVEFVTLRSNPSATRSAAPIMPPRPSRCIRSAGGSRSFSSKRTYFCRPQCACRRLNLAGST